jgi:hypothetical protein
MRNYSNHISALLIAIITLFIIAGCGREESKTDSEEAVATSGSESGGGLTWDIPAAWTAGPEKPMRLTTYIIGPAEGDSDSAECAVFYFGPTYGGGVDENMQRWAGQFEQPDGGDSMGEANIETESRDDIKITTIDLTGTYLVSGAMMQVTGKKENYRLLGAIVEGPQGTVFFKMTGPEKTMESAKAGFDAMLKSIKPGLT